MLRHLFNDIEMKVNFNKKDQIKLLVFFSRANLSSMERKCYMSLIGNCSWFSHSGYSDLDSVPCVCVLSQQMQCITG